MPLEINFTGLSKNKNKKPSKLDGGGRVAVDQNKLKIIAI